VTDCINQLVALLILNFSQTQVFDFPTLAAISSHIKSILPKLPPVSSAAKPSQRAPTSHPKRSRPPRLPVLAENLKYDDALLAVQQTLKAVLGNQYDVAPDAPLMSSGLDSLGAVELRNALEAAFKLDLPTTLVSTLGGGSLAHDLWFCGQQLTDCHREHVMLRSSACRCNPLPLPLPLPLSSTCALYSPGL